MKYHESKAQASEIMPLAYGFLNRHGLAANPVNYAVAYEHVSSLNSALSLIIDKREMASKSFDNFVMESLYADLVLKQSNLQENIVEHLDNILEGINEKSTFSNAAISRYLDMLDQGLVSLEADDADQTKVVIEQLIYATSDMKKSQQRLQAKLLESCAETEHLRMEVENLHRERTIDSLTGLQNSKAVEHHMDIWLTKYPQRKIAAISIDIDNFRTFNDSYGHLVGDVVLTKIARKISSYVSDSGLPVRVGGEEFLILLPDVDLHTANEVAEQVRKGVEKMKFVSSRSKRALPNVTISLGTSSYRAQEDLEHFVSRAENAQIHAKSTGRNKVICETAFN
jgi:diguanylate cyclase